MLSLTTVYAVRISLFFFPSFFVEYGNFVWLFVKLITSFGLSRTINAWFAFYFNPFFSSFTFRWWKNLHFWRKRIRWNYKYRNLFWIFPKFSDSIIWKKWKINTAKLRKCSKYSVCYLYLTPPTSGCTYMRNGVIPLTQRANHLCGVVVTHALKIVHSIAASGFNQWKSFNFTHSMWFW